MCLFVFADPIPAASGVEILRNGDSSDGLNHWNSGAEQSQWYPNAKSFAEAQPLEFTADNMVENIYFFPKTAAAEPTIWALGATPSGPTGRARSGTTPEEYGVSPAGDVILGDGSFRGALSGNAVQGAVVTFTSLMGQTITGDLVFSWTPAPGYRQGVELNRVTATEWKNRLRGTPLYTPDQRWTETTFAAGGVDIRKRVTAF